MPRRAFGCVNSVVSGQAAFRYSLRRRCIALDRAAALRGSAELWDSDHSCELVECSCDGQSRRGVDAEFVVVPSKVLHERVTSDDHDRGSVRLQAAHWSEPGLESAWSFSTRLLAYLVVS